MSLEETFEQAKADIQKLSERPDNNMLLQVYALNKQATIGDVNIDQPAAFDFVAMAKYNAWKSKTGMSKEDAMQQYIDLVKKLQSK